MKIFIFFGFSSDSILDKVRDTIKYQNSQEKTHKSSILRFSYAKNKTLLFFHDVAKSIYQFRQFCQSSILSIVNFINFFRTLFGRCGFFCTFANGNELKIKGSEERE